MLSLPSNAGEISFAPYVAIPTGSWPEVVAIGDINNDGRNDVVLGTTIYFDTLYDYKVFVFTQTSGGALNDAVIYNGGYISSIDIGDLNSDGCNDVVIGFSDSIGIFFQDTTDSLQPMVTHYSGENVDGVKIGDFNSDGLNDFVVCHWGSSYIRVFTQQPGGNFDTQTDYSIIKGGWDEIDAGDVNNDSLDDIVFMRGQGNDQVAVFLQDPSGFIQMPIFYDLGDTLAHGMAIGDVNGDGRNDIALSYGENNPNVGIAVWLQNTIGTLSDTAIFYTSYDLPVPVEVADLDLDGRNDLIVANGAGCCISFHQQSNSGVLAGYDTVYVPYGGSYEPQGLAVGDINEDGKPDIVLANHNNGLVVLYNTSVTGVSGEQPGKIGLKEALELKIAGNKISYGLPQNGAATLKVYNLLGQEVNTLVRENKTAGSYKINWDGRDNSGRRVSSGVYLVRLEANGQAVIGKMLVVR